MAGISDKAIKSNYAENKYRYNKGSELQNKEFSDGSGLETYDFSARMYDPQIGRFWQIDELAQLDFNYSPYAYANLNPVLFNDPTGLLSDSAHPQELQPAIVTAKKPLDTQNGQVYGTQSFLDHLWSGNRVFVGHKRVGDLTITLKYEVDKNGYLTGRLAPNLLTFDAPIGDKPILNLKAVFNIKNWIKARYVIYRGVKDGLPYIGKAKFGIEYRYTAEEIEKWGIEVIDGLENLPHNAAALGVEQLVIDLNGGAGTGALANKIPATVKEIYINAGRYWLDTNLPNWEQELKFK